MAVFRGKIMIYTRQGYGLSHTKRLIADLEWERDRFIETYGSFHVTKTNPDSGLKEFKVVLSGLDSASSPILLPMPFRILNLWNNLGHARAAATWASGITSSSLCAYFPIGSSQGSGGQH